MSQIASLLGWTNKNFDHQLTALAKALLDSSCVIGWNGWALAVTAGQANTGSAFILCTRTNWQKVMVHYENTAAVAVTTTGTKKVWVWIDQSKLDNGSSNALDGSWIASIQTGASYPSSNFLPLASITSGVITDARVMIDKTLLQSLANYGEPTTASNNYAFDANITALKVGQVYRFKSDFLSTANPTLNVSWTGAKPIKKNWNIGVWWGDIALWQIVEVSYDWTNFQMISPVSAVLSVDIHGTAEVEASPLDEVLIYNDSAGVNKKAKFAISGLVDKSLPAWEAMNKWDAVFVENMPINASVKRFEHWLTYSNYLSNTTKWWLWLSFTKDTEIISIRKMSDSYATTAYIQTLAGSWVVATATFVWDLAVFNYTIPWNTQYWIVVDSWGSTLDHYKTTSPSYPIYFDWWYVNTGVYNGGNVTPILDIQDILFDNGSLSFWNITWKKRISSAKFWDWKPFTTVPITVWKFWSPSADLWIRIETDDGTGNPSWTLVDVNAEKITASWSALSYNAISDNVWPTIASVTSNTYKRWYRIYVKKNCFIYSVKKLDSGIRNAYVKKDNWDVLWVAEFAWQTATFPLWIELKAGQYYRIEWDNAGSSYNSYYNNSPWYPISTTDIDFVGWSQDGVNDTKAMEFISFQFFSGMSDIVFPWTITIPKWKKVHLVAFQWAYGSEVVNSTNYYKVWYYSAVETSTRWTKYWGWTSYWKMNTLENIPTPWVFQDSIISKTDSDYANKINFFWISQENVSNSDIATWKSPVVLFSWIDSNQDWLENWNTQYLSKWYKDVVSSSDISQLTGTSSSSMWSTSSDKNWQAFTTVTDAILKSISFWVTKQNTPTDQLIVKIYDSSKTKLLATSMNAINATDIWSNTKCTFYFRWCILSPWTQYFAEISRTGSLNNSHYYYLIYLGPWNPYSWGNMWQFWSGVWIDSNYDSKFSIEMLNATATNISGTPWSNLRVIWKAITDKKIKIVDLPL